MSRKILTPGQVRAILARREVVNEWGEALYTGAEIATDLGVSESTVWRVIRQQAAYSKKLMPSRGDEHRAFDAALEAVKGASADDPEVKSSLERLQQHIAAAKKNPADTMLEEMSDEAKARLKEYTRERT